MKDCQTGLGKLVVSPDYQLKGIGRTLMERGIAANAGARTPIYLTASAGRCFRNLLSLVIPKSIIPFLQRP